MDNLKALEDKTVDFLLSVINCNDRKGRSIEACMRLGSSVYTVYQLPIDLCTAATLRVVKEIALSQGSIYFEAQGRYVHATDIVNSMHITVVGAAEIIN